MLDAALTLLATASRLLPPLRGRGAVGFRLGRIFRHRTTGAWSIRMKRGHRMRVPRTSTQTWAPAFTGIYDDETLDHLARLIEPGTFALDVGACFGFYSVPLGITARALGARVIAFEPLRANLPFLQNNLDANGLCGVVRVAPVGLGRERGMVRIGTESGGAGNAAVEAAGSPDPIAVEEIRLERLDDLPLPEARGGARCSLIKMDVEGFEPEVLAGAEVFIQRHRPAVLGEFNVWWLDRRGIPGNAPQLWALDHGYRCLEMVRRRRRSWSDECAIDFRPLAPSGSRSGSDLFMLPQERAGSVCAA